MEPPESHTAYRIGDFVLDTRAFRLARGSEEVPLEPKAVDVLLYLLQRPGQLVSKQELIFVVWKGTAVTDNALTRIVAQLRRALGDEAHGARYIETVPTRGYRFIGQQTPTMVAECAESLAAPEPPSNGQTRAWARPATLATVRWVALPVAVVLAAASTLPRALSLLRREQPAGIQDATVGSASSPRIRSLAVLPLRNLTGDAGQDYFVDGMTQALGDRFSQMGLLTVAATTSSMRYRNSPLPASRIATELRVDGLLEGAVMRDGNRVRVSVAVVHGPTERRLWGATYDRPVADVLALYRDIALTAAGEMSLAVTAVPNERPGESRSINPDAYDAYLRASYFVGNRWMAGGCVDAERYLLRAIELDPAFAPPYAALGWCYAYPDRMGRDIAEIGPKAKAAVSKALALDDRLAPAHLVLGTIKWRVDYDPVAAEPELRRAVELDPTSGLMHIPYGELLLWRGERAKGLAILTRAVELEPFSPDRNVQIGFALLTAGLYDEAITQCRKALELDPHYLTAQLWIAEAYGYKREYDTAVTEYLSWLDGALRPATRGGRPAQAGGRVRTWWLAPVLASRARAGGRRCENAGFGLESSVPPIHRCMVDGQTVCPPWPAGARSSLT